MKRPGARGRGGHHVPDGASTSGRGTGSGVPHHPPGRFTWYGTPRPAPLTGPGAAPSFASSFAGRAGDRRDPESKW
ncbi:hypothetical protein SLNWT_0992 [Streptomyces albus]|uniref:Uncharacterized protein n=1 Tax=Streptomyces albus (strain ATCC 21838 / DSM 41398 / FERM P-419 / JCM 4703 / NBRC 107858) TaxID=1081613 RepID=A0A0B5EGW5_STRA4|nr:hypothetical protein SLNWT_0992 [Streptomyces albus]AOU75684.1 hypothetical protein SLNHY_0993 [Streptomyces albus]